MDENKDGTIKPLKMQGAKSFHLSSKKEFFSLMVPFSRTIQRLHLDLQIFYHWKLREQSEVFFHWNKRFSRDITFEIQFIIESQN